MKKEKIGIFDHMYGSVTMGERGQVVIPKKLRDEFKLKQGSKFLVFEKQGFIVLAPDKMMVKFVAKLNKVLNKN